MKWQYGITTVPSRIEELFPRSLGSLVTTGFSDPHIFVDGEIPRERYTKGWGLSKVTIRHHPTTVLGNWILSLWELYLGNPLADRYAIFQDDVIYTRNLRNYLEKIPLADNVYWNLYTSLSDNEKLLSADNYGGFLNSSNNGRGALALVFPRSAVENLLSSRSMVLKSQAVKKNIATKRIDGGIVTAISPKYKQACSHSEWIHNPSLVQHIGDVSSIGNNGQPRSSSFPGEDFDALRFLEENK